jgi:excisionase family DNA binding protein
MMETKYPFTVEYLMEKLNVSGETVRRWCRDGRIKALKLPGSKGKYRFSQEAIEEFLDSIGNNDMPVKESLFKKKEDKPNEEK